MNPLVSFIVPVYNAEKFVAEAINSALTCGYEEIQIILVDDGSTDQSLEICSSFEKKYENITVIQHPGGVNKGVSTTRKVGIENAKGEFIYFLDSDDIIIPGILSQYVDIFNKQADVVLIHGEIKVKNMPSVTQNPEHDFIIGYSDRMYRLKDEPYYLKSDRICTSTVCVRKEALTGIAYSYNQIFPMCEDWLLWTLFSFKGVYYYFARPVIWYRIHENSLTYRAHQKGQVFLSYNLLEYYLCLLARCNDPELNKSVRDYLFDVINELYASYRENPAIKDNNIAGLEQVIPRDKLVLSLKDKIYKLERGYGYYFYFLYVIKQFLWKLFGKK